jgi:hypothetical protein
MTFEEFLKLVDQTYTNFNWRYGQSVMNVLHSVNKIKYEKLVASENDCYYDDNMVRITLDKLEKEWTNDQ